eukprot:TRINITY_DN16372_c0_g2_i1.p1 TRINITY_DN16372_c0_g2~~TRINITY_DN16372_c0_g2_i1.p1  ORF type:complete len:189 (+),score=45.39 TRINITY_DN16372_c0_g2_i1:22-567(+)
MIRRPPRSTHCISSAASDVYKRQEKDCGEIEVGNIKAYKRMRKWVFGGMRGFHIKAKDLGVVNYKELSDKEYIGFLQKLKVTKYAKKSAPKNFDYRSFELHSMERINKNPRFIIEFSMEYIDLDRGTEQCLGEMCQVISRHFDTIAREPHFDSFLHKISSLTLALNQELLAKTCNYLSNSL